MISQTPNKELMTNARAALDGKWGTAALATLVYLVFCLVGAIPLLGGIICIVIAGPLMLGYYSFMLSVARGGEPEVGAVFSGFNKFGKAFRLYWLVAIFTLLWTLLLIIPGIIAAFSYSMSYFILLDNPDMNALDAIAESKKIMQDNKWKLFCLYFRFIGWWFLCLLTLGIGFLWFAPYSMVSMSKFYEEIKEPKAV
jgi:uncharacterized membrane protein